ncbi:molybdopterin molybdotransferase MoeA [Schumannella soli]|uniref:Molybdopterin molybdenumtransferase n=1 Tax=Schumannella soli TaxID=2590779 RepID=A0A506XRZ1_9MICO|nr:gephyrin-like molybdotransferase Glp [Schumannella soli]TPW75504.1 molybdopterin molybdotransferase MoeA [Schumannella soli]
MSERPFSRPEHFHVAARPTVAEHAAVVASLVRGTLPGGSELVPLDEALGRVTVEPVASPVDLPLFRNSHMDGFAVRAADLAAAPVTLPVAAVVAATAGEPPALAPGTAIRIMTGAPVPEGADAIVPVEQVESRAETVTFAAPVAAGVFVRERGSDLRAGDELIPAGRRLASRHLAALAAAGLGEVAVRPRAHVAILTTGSELVDVGAVPRPGEIHDANAVAAAAAVVECGGVVALRGRAQDDRAVFDQLLGDAVRVADLVITSGGISQGDFEVVRESLLPRGGWVGTIAMQPGGPQALAMIDGVPVIGFPGNPVSTQLSFEAFVAPLLREHAGLPMASRTRRRLRSSIVSPAGRQQLLRARLAGDDEVEPVSGPGSHLVAALAAADAVIVVPAETTELPAAAEVEVWGL